MRIGPEQCRKPARRCLRQVAGAIVAVAHRAMTGNWSVWASEDRH
jgi:hypothetical protein